MKIVFDSEAELETYIYEKFLEDGVVCIDDTAPMYFERQLNLGSYGIADLVAITIDLVDPEVRYINVNVYELKKEKITADAFSQVARYAAGLRKAISAIDRKAHVEIACTLVATDIDESCFILNESMVSFYKAYFDPASGVSFEDMSEGWARGDSSCQTIADILSKQIPVLNKSRGFGFE